MTEVTPDPPAEEREITEVLTEDLRGGIFDVTGVSLEAARDFGDRRANQERTDTDLGIVRRTLKRIWHTEFDRYYREKHYAEGVKRVQESGNLFELEEGVLSSDKAEQALIDRAISDIEGAVAESAGERSIKLDEMDEGTEIKNRVWDLLQEANEQGWDEAAFQENATELIKNLASEHPELFGEGVLFANSLWDIQRTVKHAIDHGDALERIRNEVNLDLRVGELSAGVRGELATDTADKVYGKIRSTGLRVATAGAVDAAKIALPLAATVGVVKVAAKKSVAAAGLITGGTAVFAGVRGVYRERRRLKQERHMHMREAAQGKTTAEFPNPDEIDTSTIKGKLRKRAVTAAIRRREAIQGTAYETVSARGQIDSLRSYLDEDGQLDIDSSDRYQAAMDQLALTRTADIISNREGIDLISYSAVDRVDEERWELLQAKAELAARLKEKWGEFAPEGIDPDVDGFETILAQRGMILENEFIREDIDTKDALFNKMRSWRSKQLWKAGTVSAAMGALIAGTAQELAAQAQDGQGPLPDIDGLGESPREPGEGETLLAGIENNIDGDQAALEQAAAELAGESEVDASEEIFSFEPPVEGLNTASLGISEQTSVELPAGFHLGEVHESTDDNIFAVYTEVDGKNTEVARIELDESGAPTTSSVSELERAGVIHTVNSEAVTFHSGEYVTQTLENGQQVTLPEGYAIVAQENGLHEVHTADGEILGALQFDEAGRLIDDQLSGIEGVNVTSETILVDGQEEVLATDIRTYLDNADATRVHRELWYGNGTEHSDLNELRVYAGGENGSWKDTNGNVIVDVSSMFEGGSFQNGEVADINELIENNQLKAAVTLSRDTQSEALLFDIEVQTNPETGEVLYNDRGEAMVHAVIDADSGAASLFSGDSAENRAFSGRYLEIMELTGEQSGAGAEEVRVLATFVGENNTQTLTETVTTTTEVNQIIIDVPQTVETDEHTLRFGELANVTTGVGEATEATGAEGIPPIDINLGQDVAEGIPPIDVNLGQDTAEGIPPIEVTVPAASEAGEAFSAERAVYPYYIGGPLYARGGLARMSNGERAERGAEGGAERGVRRWQDRSPRLKEDPNAKLVLGEELPWYREILVQRRGEEYVNAVEAAVEQGYGLELIDNNIEGIVTLSIDAVRDADSLYELIEMYLKQGHADSTDENDAFFQVFVELDWSESEQADPQTRRRIDKAREELERLMENYSSRVSVVEKKWPSISVIEKQWPDDEAEADGHTHRVRQHLMDALMLSLQKAMEKDDDDDEHVLSADADPIVIHATDEIQGVERKFVQRILGEARSSQADAFVGASRIQTDDYDDYPGLGAVANLKAILDRLSSRRESANVSRTNDVSTGVRASMLAAIGGIGFDEEPLDGREIGYRINAARDQRNPRPNELYRIMSQRDEVPSGEDSGEFIDERKPIKAVLGAQVDHDDAEFVAGYLQKGERTDGFPVEQPEDFRIEHDINLMLDRYEQSVSAMLTDDYRDPGTARAAINMSLGPRDNEGNDTYELRWHNGAAQFELTEAGREFLRNLLFKRSASKVERGTGRVVESRRGAGRIGPIGNRTRLNLYSVKKREAKRLAKRDVARLLRRGEHPDAA